MGSGGYLWMTTGYQKICSCKCDLYSQFFFLPNLQPLKWELKQKPGMSPPHGGFNPDDPNQQIVAEDIFDEYGGEIFVSYKKTQ